MGSHPYRVLSSRNQYRRCAFYPGIVQKLRYSRLQVYSFPEEILRIASLGQSYRAPWSYQHQYSSCSVPPSQVSRDSGKIDLQKWIAPGTLQLSMPTLKGWCLSTCAKNFATLGSSKESIFAFVPWPAGLCRRKITALMPLGKSLRFSLSIASSMLFFPNT